MTAVHILLYEVFVTYLFSFSSTQNNGSRCTNEQQSCSFDICGVCRNAFCRAVLCSQTFSSVLIIDTVCISAAGAASLVVLVAGAAASGTASVIVRFDLRETSTPPATAATKASAANTMTATAQSANPSSPEEDDSMLLWVLPRTGEGGGGDGESESAGGEEAVLADAPHSPSVGASWQAAAAWQLLE